MVMNVAKPVAGKFRRSLAWRAGAMPLATVLLFSSTVVGQEPGQLPNTDKGIVQWLVALGLVILICASAFLNPKRTHLD